MNNATFIFFAMVVLFPLQSNSQPDCSTCTEAEKRKLELLQLKANTDAYKAILENVRELGEDKEAALKIIPESDLVLRAAVKAIDGSNSEKKPEIKAKPRKKIVRAKAKRVDWSKVQVVYAQVNDSARGIKGNVILKAGSRDLQVVEGEFFNYLNRKWKLNEIKRDLDESGLPTFTVGIANSSGRIVKKISWK